MSTEEEDLFPGKEEYTKARINVYTKYLEYGKA
jgi:hypothetical protein